MRKAVVVLVLLAVIPGLMLAGDSYDKERQIHSLAFISNYLSMCRFDSVSAMEKCAAQLINSALADPEIQSYLGSDWTTVWGPVVYTNNPDADSIIADNTMAVFYSPSQNLFVISIAGTNPISIYGWIKEDLSVNNMVHWNKVIKKPLPLFAKISQGTNTGLQILINIMKEKHTSASMLNVLKDYIIGNKISGAEVAVAGHSLGGALSPVLALYMVDTWELVNNTTISTYPSAGPTPGSWTFADYYESKIRDKKITYASKYNTLDAVPMAWEADTLSNIPALYKDKIGPVKKSDPDLPSPTVGVVSIGLFFNAMATKIGSIPLADPYRQVQPWTPLKGTFNQELDDEVTFIIGLLDLVLPKKLKPYLPYLINFARFAAQAADQHTTQYGKLLEISDFLDRMHAMPKACCKASAAPHVAAVKEATGIDLNSVKEKVEAIKKLKKKGKKN